MIIKLNVHKCKECDHYFEDVYFDAESGAESFTPKCDLGETPREKKLCSKYRKNFEYGRKDIPDTCAGCRKFKKCTDKVDASPINPEKKIYTPGLMCDRYN